MPNSIPAATYLPRTLRDGATLSLLASAYLLVLLRFYPRMFLRHYPREVQAIVPPKSAQEQRTSLVLGLLLAVPYGAALLWRTATLGTHAFWDIFFYTFGVLSLFNLTDLLILDWLIVCRLKPRWATLPGTALSDTTIDATLPLKPWLGNVTMWIGERKVPMVQLTPTSVSFIVPWDLPSSAPIRMLAEAAGDNTPFYFPETETSLYPNAGPRAGAIYRQDWTPTFVGPIHTGEIIHVFATGFGPVAPDVPEGAAAPSAEPYARLTSPLTCSNAEVLYAGLAPFAVERIYQIDLRIGPTPGYQKFTCTQAPADPFLFLTLDIQ